MAGCVHLRDDTCGRVKALLATSELIFLFSPDAQGGKALRARFAGFLAGVDQFDASLFGVAGAEADLMDPQQRLLMEVRWLLQRQCCYARCSMQSLHARQCLHPRPASCPLALPSLAAGVLGGRAMQRQRHEKWCCT